MMSKNILRHLCVLSVTGLFLLGPSAQAADTPNTLSGTKLVAAEDVQKLQAAGALIVDTRVANEYADGHIKGAVSIPYREKSEKSASFDAAQDEFAVAKLPPNKGTAVVLYCNGPECWKSYKASVASIKAGYTNLRLV